MKVIQVSMEERLLKRLDAQEAVQERGRSAVIREALQEWLRARREKEIDESYRRAYGTGSTAHEDFTDWLEAGAWPED